MARMRPAEARDDTRSTAERSLFDVIHTQLDNSWIALHSLGLVIHPRKPWAEIDFVLVGPPGVFCLEVKGQRVSRRDGKWIFTTRNGIETAKQEGPFEQAGSASAALTHYLFDRLPAMRVSLSGYGVLTPDMTFDIEGPDIEPLIVYDARDTAREFGAYVARLVDYWTRRIHGVSGRKAAVLSASTVESVADLLRADFDGRPSLRAEANQVNSELLRMTNEQYRILDGLVDNERAFVRGGAGTGKTLLAVEEAKRQAKLGRSVLLCCFNRKLAQFLDESLRAFPLIQCQNLHAFMATLIREAGLLDQLPAASKADLFAVFYPEYSLRAIESGASFKPFDVLIIDEGQDILRETYVEVLDRALVGHLSEGRWRIFFDPRQNLFDGTDAIALQRVLAYVPAQFKLTVNCRNTAAVATATSLLADVECDETLAREGPLVRTLWYATREEQDELVASELRRLVAGGLAASDITVLCSRAFDEIDLHKARAEFGISENGPRRSGVRFATTSSYKGLESDAIVVMGVEDLTTPLSLKSMYVSTSRPRVFLSVLIDRRAESDYQILAEKFGARLGSVLTGRGPDSTPSI